MRIAILMPCFNEPGPLAGVLRELRDCAPALGAIVVYVVDDGGQDAIVLSELPSSTPHFDVVLARHAVNLGQGAAIETARCLALRDGGYDAYVTMDSDGQHRVEDLPRLVAAVERGADVALGNRFAAPSNVPLVRRAVLRAARVFEFLVTGIWLSDAHNGYRAFSARALSLLRIHQNRMAHATEIKQFLATHRKTLRVTEVPVTIRYSDETLAKGQSSLGAVAILKDLAFRFLFGPE